MARTVSTVTALTDRSSRRVPEWADGRRWEDGSHNGPSTTIPTTRQDDTPPIEVNSSWHPTAGAEIWLATDEGRPLTPTQAYEVGMRLMYIATLTGRSNPEWPSSLDVAHAMLAGAR